MLQYSPTISLIRELALTDFKLKYQGSIIGYFWTLVKPLALFGVLYLVFSRIGKFGEGIDNYPLYLLIGVVFWSYFADCTNMAMRSVVDRSDLIRKVYFPRIIVIIASTISVTITFALNLIIVFAFLLITGEGVHLSILNLIPIILELYVFILGISLILSGLFVKFRDIGHIWEVALQILFYASAVIFPIAPPAVPAEYLKFFLANPIVQILQDARASLLGGNVVTTWNHNPLIGAFCLFAVVCIFLIGYSVFKARSPYFAEDI